MGDRSSMSISANGPSDETLTGGPLTLLLQRQYEFPFGINIVQFSIFNFQFSNITSSSFGLCGRVVKGEVSVFNLDWCLTIVFNFNQIYELVW